LVEGGRVAILHLYGPYGNLEICCVYLDATSSSERCRVLKHLGGRMRVPSSTLTVSAGDFNFVMDEKDRWSSEACRWADNGDSRDAEILHEHVLQPFAFHEWEQVHFTCEAKGARARLDRIYINQHLSLQLDHNCSAYVEEWCEGISVHRPVGVSRSKGGNKDLPDKPMQAWAFKHADFADRVQVHYRFLLHDSNLHQNSVSRLLILKEAIRFVHDNIVRERQVVVATSAEDQLGWALIYVRALESRNYERANHASLCYSRLASCGKPSHQPCIALHDSALCAHMQCVRDLIVELAHEDIRQHINDLQASTQGQAEGETSRAKECILRKLKRLSPGEASCITCIVDDNGVHHTSPPAMAGSLKNHWGEVFGPAGCNTDLLKDWLSTLFPRDEQGGWNTSLLEANNADWKVRRKHVKNAIKFAKCGMPGPDGISAQAYKSLGDLAVDVLFDVYKTLASDQAIGELVAAYEGLSPEQTHDFNVSILCLLPKKPTGVDESFGTYYHPKDTRPLSISNVDNRLLASAARLAWEPVLERWVSKFQRGFLKGRSMLHNVIDVDTASMTVSLKHEHGALVLFDFKAAFPSVSHPFLIQCLELLGLPKEAMNFIQSLYHDNRCVIRIQGHDFPGFCMLGGVRQGCPLSPLLFAVCVDILLRRIVHDLPDCICRAFADDIAAVISNWNEQGPVLENIFSEFGLISNLSLNISKTICMPLWCKGLEELSGSVSLSTPTWKDICISSKGTYLGFVIGPGKGTHSWQKPLDKFKDRVARWSKIGAGMQFAAVAYNTFALSTLLYVAQLEVVPDFVLQEERDQLLKMFPGPGNWAIPEDLWYLREHYGLAKSATSLAMVSRAAKLRVATLGCHFNCQVVTPHRLRRLCQDNIFARTHAVQHAMNQTGHYDRLYFWDKWYSGHYCKTLVDNVRWLKSQGIDALGLCAQFTASEHVWTGAEFDHIKSGFQRAAHVAIKALLAPQPVQRIRDKLERWRGIDWGISGHPGVYSHLVAKRLRMLSGLVTPRVQAAVFNTLWNAWCTHRRYQKRHLSSNRCVFCCGGGAEDSLEHYSRCPTILRVARHTLRFNYTDESAMDMWALNSPWLDIRENLMALALLIYGAYMAFNSCRHNGVSDSSQALHCIMQHCKQGAMGHGPSMNFLDSRWQCQISHIC